VFGPGDKLAWLEAVAFDPRSTPFEARIAIALSNRIDKFTGNATIGQVWLAGRVHGTERVVRTALKPLASRQHLTIEPSRGRRLAHVYKFAKSGAPVRAFAWA
jgi:hypothetical protein